MFIKRKALLVVACLATLLGACGGGDSGSSSAPAPAPTYGAIYVNALLGGGITANYSSAALAAESAKAYCVSASSSVYSGSTCTLVLEYGQNLCGALYRGLLTATTGTYGVASASTAAVAESNALAACKSKGVANCSFGFSACNGTGAPSNNSVKGISISDSSPINNNINEILQSE
jgi:Domain of unknown function (DUF4189)